MHMTPADTIRAFLEQAQQRADAATEGPWVHKSESAENVYGPSPFSSKAEEQIAMLMWPCHHPEKTEAAENLWFDTGEFIADARTTVPKLVRALQMVVQALESIQTENPMDGHSDDMANAALAEVAEILNAEPSEQRP